MQSITSPRPPPLPLSLNLRPISELYSDSRSHGYQGETRNVRLPRTTSGGSGSIAKSEDGTRCVVAGKESLRVLRVSEYAEGATPDHKSSAGRGGHRIDASKNFWDGSGLKIDSASTDVAWGHGGFSNKILTSARNGELIMWDLNKAGPSKCERRTKDHIRSIHKLSYSTTVPHYCVTGSADGDLRVWDLRDMSKSLMRIHHPTSVRSVVFSPNPWQPLQVVVGLDSGSIYRWDLQMGQRGQLDRLPVAHSGPILALDWCNSPGLVGLQGDGGHLNGMGWLASGGLDRSVKVWDLTAPNSHNHIPSKPMYTLHPSFPIRRLLWRPSYDCELAVVSCADFSLGSNPDLSIALDGSLRLDLKDDYRLARNLGSMAGDALEIWDVRRSWIAKWSIGGSATEGVADIAFKDSHAIWAQHYSGTFAQLDVRDSTKPMDAIPRVAATWEVSGSVAFVSDRRTRWERPYDDIHPEKKYVARERGLHLKTLGDKPFVPKMQNFGTYADPFAGEEYETFSKLASSYVVEGDDRKKICSLNAEAAFEARKHESTQTWLLLGSLLPDLPLTPPPSPPIPPRPPATPLPHAVSAPAGLTTPDNLSPSFTFPPKVHHRPSPARSASAHTYEREPTLSAPTSINPTPTSSASSSPHRYPIGLPPLTTPRRPSIFTGRDSLDRGPSAPSTRRPSHRRPSTSTLSTNTTPSETSKAANLRHVGEGTLDDSDSSAEEDGDGDERSSGDEEGEIRPLTSPHLAKASMGLVHPSPLSRVAGWSEGVDSGREADDGEDEEDEDGDESGPSPPSTDSESSGSSSPGKQGSRSRRQSLKATKSRSRSSTVASLAAPPLIRQESATSVMTVTAGTPSIREGDADSLRSNMRDNGSLRALSANHSRRGSIDPLRELGKGSVERMFPSHRRNRSHAISLELGNNTIHERATPEKETPTENGPPSRTRNDNIFSEKRKAAIRAGEEKFRGIGWDALRDALERFANDGDVQMCALLSVVAAQELRVGKRRVLRFVESYIDVLDRLRLHTASAHLRKYAKVDDIQAMTGLETMIYTSCGSCKKSITQRPGAQRSKGGFGYCSSCRTQVVKCSICHLPVRTLLFQCSVCAHGGHQECYRRYYMERPMVNMATTTSSMVPSIDPQVQKVLNKEREPSTRSDDGSLSDAVDADSSIQFPTRGNRMLGHACVAGCGHFCWVAGHGQSDES